LALLFGPEADSPGAIAHWIASADPENLGRALEGLPKATREAAVREVAAAARGLLNVNLIDVLIAGWRKHQDLTSAARRTLAAPGSTELVQLATHRVTEAQQPYISVLVDGHCVATLHLDLSVVFDVSALLAGISAGRLVALRAGHCDITARLAVEGTDVVTRRTRLELPGVISLGTGIRLLPAEDYPPGAEQAETADDESPGNDTDPANAVDWRSESAWIADKPIYLRVAWGSPSGGPMYASDLVSALWNIELLYDFSLLLAHPAYQGFNLTEPNEFFTSGWRALERHHRLEASSVEHHSPLLFLAVIPLAAAGAAGVWAIAQTFEKVANFSLNRRKLKAEVDKTEAETRHAVADARRAEAEAESAEYQRLLDRRQANITAGRLKAQIQATPMPIVDAELTGDKPAA